MKKITRLIQLIILIALGNIDCHAQSITVSASTLTNVSCYGGHNGLVSATASAGNVPYTYVWSPGGQTNLTAVNLTAATYTVHVTDRLGFTASAPATVTQPTALSISAWATYSAVCAGQTDSLFVSSSGGTIPMTYSWIGPLDDISAPSSARTSCYPYGAAYIVSGVSDYNGCSATASVSITVYTPPFVSIQGPLSPVTTFNNDTLIAISPGASSYLWSNSATTSAIIVSPVVTTQYTVTTTDTHGCLDTARYIVSANSSGNGRSSGTAIAVSPSTSVIYTSYSSLDSTVWFSLNPTDSNLQIICNSVYLGLPFPHTHRLTLYDNSLNMIVDEPLPDIVGANQIRIDISHLHPGSTYYVRAARCPAHANMQGCNPSASGECNPFMRWDFQMCFRTVPVFVPNDSGNEAPSISQLYYNDRGQIADLNDIPRFDIKAYTNFAFPAVYASDSAVSFVYGDIDTIQRVDMVCAGTYVQPSQPVFKMDEDSGAGYLNYIKEYTVNSVAKIEGYSRLIYKNEYPNIDMQVYSNDVGTKLYFVCNPAAGGSPGGNPANIELKFKGATSVNVTGGGALNVVTELGTLSFAPGYAYTDSAGIIKPKGWQAYFVAVNSNTVRFNTGAFNSNEPLIIQVDRGHITQPSNTCDGNLCWSTYFGGTNANDFGAFRGVTHDNRGAEYAVGYTTSAHFPLDTFVFHMKYKGDTDAVIVKFSNDSLKWSTYYGGSGSDIGRSIAVDAGGNAFITGWTNSTNFRVGGSSGYIQYSLNGNNSGPNTDAFIAKIDNSGFGPIWSTYYGGPGNDQGHSIVLDAAKSIVDVVGDGSPKDSLVHQAGAYNDTAGTGLILKFSTINYSLEWATHVPPIGTGFNGCAVDANHNLYVTGTSIAGYPSNGNPYSGGNSDAVMTQFNIHDTIGYSTYYGGDARDVGNGIAVDSRNNVFFTGHTYSGIGTNIQLAQQHSWQFLQDSNGNGYNGTNGNAFIAEYNQSLGSISWGTYFGGVGDIDASAIATDANDNVYITGTIEGIPPNPLVLPAGGEAAGTYDQTGFPRDFNETFVAAFNVGGGYYWGTALAGTQGTSSGYGITAYTPTGTLFVVGTAGGSNFHFINPDPGGWFENTNLFMNGANSIPYISRFNLLGIPTEISEVKTKRDEVNVYPNPTLQNVTVKLNVEQTGKVEFTLYNLLGEPVYSEIANESTGTINKQISLSALPNGNYILQVISGSNVYHAKITKLQ